MTVGGRAAAEWMRARKLATTKPWFVEIALDTTDRQVSITYNHDTDTRFHLDIYPEEWGVFFCHGSRASWLRVTDQPFVHGRDDHQLLGELPELAEVTRLVTALEHRYRVRFRRDLALVRTNVPAATRAVHDWLAQQ